MLSLVLGKCQESKQLKRTKSFRVKGMNSWRKEKVVGKEEFVKVEPGCCIFGALRGIVLPSTVQ